MKKVLSTTALMLVPKGWTGTWDIRSTIAK